MDKVCSVNVTATVHDAVHKIQDELIENNQQVGFKDILRFLYIYLKTNFSCYYLIYKCDKSNIAVIILTFCCFVIILFFTLLILIFEH